MIVAVSKEQASIKSIDMTDMAVGIYYVKVFTENDVTTKKITKIE